MGLWSFITGEDLDAIEAQSAATDAKLAELNRQKLENGSWNQATYDQASANLDKSRIIDAEGQVADAAAEGFQEGVANVRGTIGDILALPFRLIPPIGWLLIAGALFFYFGGGVLVRKKVTSA
jgi:hypothetical protein